MFRVTPHLLREHVGPGQTVFGVCDDKQEAWTGAQYRDPSRAQRFCDDLVMELYGSICLGCNRMLGSADDDCPCQGEMFGSKRITIPIYRKLLRQTLL